MRALARPWFPGNTHGNSVPANRKCYPHSPTEHHHQWHAHMPLFVANCDRLGSVANRMDFGKIYSISPSQLRPPTQTVPDLRLRPTRHARSLPGMRYGSEELATNRYAIQRLIPALLAAAIN